MKLDCRRLAAIAPTLPRLRVVCLYGDSDARVRDCARAVVAAEAGTSDDPFRVTACDGEERDAIRRALASPSLAGGRPTVWVHHAGERLAAMVTEIMEGTADALLVLEFGGATGKSRLRAAVERSDRGCIIACYADARGAKDALKAALGVLGVTADAPATALLLAHAEAAGQDDLQSVALLAALYAGPGGRLDLEAARQLGTHDSVSHGDEGFDAGLAGDSAGMDRAISQAGEDGVTGVALARTMLLRLQRLRAALLQGNATPDGLGGRSGFGSWGARPSPAALARWNPAQASAAAQALWRVERSAKATGAPQELLCREAVLRLARMKGAAERGS